ncbi:MAG: hypothetical protein ACOYKE_10205 [Ferruginibacter sp.]
MCSTDRPQKGWYIAAQYPDGTIRQKELYSNGLMIEYVEYAEDGVVVQHLIYNNRLKQLIPKPVSQPLPRPNIAETCMHMGDVFRHLPAISRFIEISIDPDKVHAFWKNFVDSEAEHDTFTVKGEDIAFSIYFEKYEGYYQCSCWAKSEERYKAACALFESFR